MSRAASRRVVRLRAYHLAALVALFVVGVIFLNIMLGYARKKSAQLYREPERSLVLIFAQNEARFYRTAGRYASLEELVKAGVVAEECLSGPVEGYRYRVVASVSSFTATAVPEGEAPPPPPPPPGVPHRERPRRYFAVDETHTVRAENDRLPGPQSPVVWSPRDQHY